MDGTGPPEPYWITRPSGHETSAHLSIAPKSFRSRVMVRWPTPGTSGQGDLICSLRTNYPGRRPGMF